ncbi:MAG: hypothetical protein QXE31_05665 [Candidatus Woesearchaeota archaeon]
MKKAQLQIMENALVILVVFIILIFAFIFFLGYQNQQLKEKDREFKQLEMIKKIQLLNSMVELQCMGNNQVSQNCYDILKIESFKDILNEEKFYYEPLFGNVKIFIKQFEPSPDCYDCLNGDRWIKTWEIYDNPKKENKGFLEIQMPILLRNVVDHEDKFGVLFLRIYE